VIFSPNGCWNHRYVEGKDFDRSWHRWVQVMGLEVKKGKRGNDLKSKRT
jgi:hypothetical protein